MAIKPRSHLRLYPFGRGLHASTATVFGIMFAALSACGGSIPRRLACVAPSRSAFTPLHVSSISGSNEIRRWADHERPPLRVWVEPRTTNAPLGADSLAESMVERAFHAWDRSQIPVRVAFVADRIDADIAVTFVDRFRTTIDGQTSVVWDCRGMITHGLVQLALRKPTGQVLGDSMRLSIATHEAGHALGLGHSRDTTDLMSPLIHVTHPSAADLAMLRVIYLDDRVAQSPRQLTAVAGR